MPNATVRAAAPGLPAARQTDTDPMLETVKRWRSALERFAVETDGLDDDASDKVAETTWKPVFATMFPRAPRTTTHAGALAAIELVARDIEDSTEPWHGPFLASALDFLKRSDPNQHGGGGEPAHATHISEAFAGPGLYLFEDALDYPVFRERGRIWRVAARLRPPLPPEDVQFELYAVDGSSDGPVLIMSPRAFDAAAPRWFGETVGEAVDALLSEIETDFGRVKALNHALASVSASGHAGADKDQDRQVIGYLTKEIDRILDWIDERRWWVVAHVSATHEPEPEAVDSER